MGKGKVHQRPSCFCRKLCRYLRVCIYVTFVLSCSSVCVCLHLRSSPTHNLGLCWQPLLQTSCCRLQWESKNKSYRLLHQLFIIPSTHLCLWSSTNGIKPSTWLGMCRFIPVSVCSVQRVHAAKIQPCAPFLSGDPHLYPDTRAGKCACMYLLL